MGGAADHDEAGLCAGTVEQIAVSHPFYYLSSLSCKKPHRLVLPQWQNMIREAAAAAAADSHVSNRSKKKS